MALELVQDFRLRWNDFNRYGHIVPNSVLDICQTMAITHAEEMGIGRAKLLEQNLVWVLVRMKYKVLRVPDRDMVSVRAWPHSASKVSFQRDFEFRDSTGIALKATSEWVLMNQETRKFARFDGSLMGEVEYSTDRAFESKPKKIAPSEISGEPLLKMKPGYDDIDLNGHVNNARYPGYVMNALRLGPDDAIRTLQLDYRHELAPDNDIAIYAQRDDKLIRASGVLEDGTVAFSCAIELV